MEARRQLQRVAREANADPAEVCFAVTAFHERDLDVATQLLRVDALADLVRTTDGTGAPATAPTDPDAVVERLAAVLGARLGFRLDPTRPRRSEDAHLHRTLDTHHGLPVTLSALYTAVARRLGAQAFVVNLPGHVVAAVTDGVRTVAYDAAAGGTVLDEPALVDLVARATGGRVAYRRAMLRPASGRDLARRVLANLTVDLTRERHAGAAVWTVVARLALPDPDPRDHVLLGDLLERSGRFRRAAEAYDRYLEVVPDAPDAEAIRHRARAARARLN